MFPLSPSTKICDGRYEIQKSIGAGGEGAVYLAIDRSLNRKVAIKQVHDSSSSGDGESQQAERDQAIKEATRLASLQHPNIVTIYDFIREPSGILVIMEFLDGKNVDQFLEPMSLGLFYKFAEQCLRGLIAAHDIGMIHRDIKPSNIIVLGSAHGEIQVKILDFGLAKVITKPTEQTKDQSGALMGSIFMMSPEQLRSEPIDFRADIYSLGGVFYKALTRAHPFQGDTVAAVINSHLQHDFQPLRSLRPDLPETLTTWVENLFSLDPGNRPTSAKEALTNLHSIQTALANPSQRPRKPLPPNIIVHRHEDSPYVTLELQAPALPA